MLKNLPHNQKNIFLLALFCLLHFSLFSQQSSLQGQVKDANSQEVIPYATVQNINEGGGVFADNLGNFRLPVKALPAHLVISSVGYQSDTILIENWSSELSILLKKDNNLLPIVEIMARQKLKAINDQTYFPHNFVMWKGYAFLLSKKGTFGKFQIEVFDEQGNLFKTHQLDLGSIQDIEVNCLNKFFIGNKTHSINLDYTAGKFVPLSKMASSDYEKIFENCRCQNDENLFYEFKLVNGLVKKYIKADKVTGDSELFKEIKEEERLELYQHDVELIREGNRSSNMGDISALENKRIRNAQAQGDFFEQIFYKNFKDNYLFTLNEQLILFNHEEGKIEFFGEENYHVPMPFVEDKTYMELILLDEVKRKTYAVFNVPKGIIIKEINLKTGQAQKEYFLEVANFKKIEIQNDLAFVLGIRESAGANATKSFFIKRLE